MIMDNSPAYPVTNSNENDLIELAKTAERHRMLYGRNKRVTRKYYELLMQLGYSPTGSLPPGVHEQIMAMAEAMTDDIKPEIPPSQPKSVTTPGPSNHNLDESFEERAEKKMEKWRKMRENVVTIGGGGGMPLPPLPPLQRTDNGGPSAPSGRIVYGPGAGQNQEPISPEELEELARGYGKSKAGRGVFNIPSKPTSPSPGFSGGTTVTGAGMASMGLGGLEDEDSAAVIAELLKSLLGGRGRGRNLVRT